MRSKRLIGLFVAISLFPAALVGGTGTPVGAANVSAPSSGRAPQGDWVGSYGANGYVVAAWNNTADLVQPGVAAATLERGGRWQWAASSTEARALESPDQAQRKLATYFDATQVRVRLNFAQAYSGTLHLYAVDGDTTARRQKISVSAGNTRSVSLTSAFDQGMWSHFPLTVAAGDSVVVTVDRTAGPNAVLSGLFLGGPTTTTVPPPTTTTTTTMPPATTTTTVPPATTTTTTTPVTPPASGTAPQGDWVGSYGANGYVVAAWNNSTDLSQPGVASTTLEQGGRWQWAASSTEARAVESPDQAQRKLATYFDATQVRVRLSFAQTYSGTLHLYAVDGDGTARRQNVSVNNGTTRTLSLTSAFDQGMWGHFPLSVAAGGSVVVTVDRTAGPNAVLSGLFLGGPTATTTTPTTAPPTTTTTTRPPSTSSRTPAFPLFPTAETTGVLPGSTLTNYAGPVTTDGAVIQNARITGQVRVRANNVTFRNCELASNESWAIWVDAGFNGLTLEDCTHTSGGIIPPVQGLTLRRSKVTPTYNRDGITVPYSTVGGIGRDVLIEDSYIRALYADPGDHLDGIQFFSFGRITNITIRHNYIEARDNSGSGVLANAALFMADGTYENVVVEQNYLDATGYYTLRLYSDGATSGHIVRSNRWGRAGGPSVDLYRMYPAVWEDNRYQDNGQVVAQPAIRTN